VTPPSQSPQTICRTTETALALPSFGRTMRLLGRGLRLRCPHCGQGAVLGRWAAIRERCRACRFRYTRSEDNYFGGAMFCSIMLIEAIFGRSWGRGDRHLAYGSLGQDYLRRGDRHVRPRHRHSTDRASRVVDAGCHLSTDTAGGMRLTSVSLCGKHRIVGGFERDNIACLLNRYGICHRLSSTVLVLVVVTTVTDEYVPRDNV
jgi:hypothetical protein